MYVYNFQTAKKNAESSYLLFVLFLSLYVCYVVM